jgi:BolA protein
VARGGGKPAMPFPACVAHYLWRERSGMTNMEKILGATRADRITETLTKALSPVAMTIEDESARHAGHAGAAAGGETHYRVSVVSESFRGLGRVERSRMVHHILSNELSTGLHALSLSLRSPNEM